MKNTYLETTEKTTKLIITHCEKGETLKLIAGINKIISEVIGKIDYNEIIEYLEKSDLSSFELKYKEGYKDAIKDIKRYKLKK